jgi:hypothetical protein
VPYDLKINTTVGTIAETATTVNPWEPVLAAAVGAAAALIVGILTQSWTGHRENVRWDRERSERQNQWQREREDRQDQWRREDSQRWLQIRQQTYARLIADLHDWDDKLRTAVTRCKLDVDFGGRTKIDKTEAEQARRAAREDLALVQFMAPQEIAGRARYAVSLREVIQVIHLEPEPETKEVNIAELDKQWENAFQTRKSLEQVMRDDLGIDSLMQPIEPQSSVLSHRRICRL